MYMYSTEVYMYNYMYCTFVQYCVYSIYMYMYICIHVHMYMYVYRLYSGTSLKRTPLGPRKVSSLERHPLFQRMKFVDVSLLEMI